MFVGNLNNRINICSKGFLKYSNKMKLLVAIAVLATVQFVEPHGYLKSPLARTSIQLDPSYPYDPPYSWNNQGQWCDNVLQDLQNSQCGRCGEALGNGDASQGGMYDKGHIVASYQAGSQIPVTLNFGAPHYGSFDIELCPQETETDNCFQLLPVVGATEEVRDGSRVCVPYDNTDVDIVAYVQLPAGVTCSRCTLRWNYRTSYPGSANPWDICFNPNPCQVFRNCADISIN